MENHLYYKIFTFSFMHGMRCWATLSDVQSSILALCSRAIPGGAEGEMMLATMEGKQLNSLH